MKKRIHIKLAPQHITKILGKYGMERTTKELGITETAVKKYIKNNAAPKATEVAAQLLLEKDIPTGSGQAFALIKCDQEILNMISKINHVTLTPLV